MKLIIAYIQPHKLNDVKQALYKAEVYKMSVTNSLGCGQQKGYQELYRGVPIEVNLLKKVRLAIAVNENFVERTIEALTVGAQLQRMKGNRGEWIRTTDLCVPNATL